MRRLYNRQPGKARPEMIISFLLVIAIAITAALPAGHPDAERLSAQALFTIVEGDYTNPVLSSPRTLKVLNLAAQNMAHFAGFDNFATRLEISDTTPIVSITRYTGELFSILNIPLCLQHKGRNQLPVYISEAFWERAFARRSDIIGTQLTIHRVCYTIAGVTRDYHGLLASTDIWLPMEGTKSLNGISSMRILSALNTGTELSRAQKELSRTFARFLPEQAYSSSTVKLVPLDIGIELTDSVPMVAGGATRPVFASGT